MLKTAVFPPFFCILPTSKGHNNNVGGKKMKRFFVATILCVGLMALGGGYACTNDVSDMRRYSDGDRYCVGNFTYAASEITGVDIAWEGGSIEIEQCAAAELSVSEETPDEKAENRLHYFMDGTELKIRYCASGLKGKIDAFNKTLHVEIPMGVDLEIENLDADVSLGVLDLSEFSLSTKSGNVSAEKIVCKKGEIETKTGSVTIGDFVADEFDAESQKGDLRLGFSKPTRGEIENADGDTHLSLYSSVGAKVYFLTRSGEFSSKKDYEKEGKNYLIAGQDFCLFEVETGSGSLTIE